MKVMRISRLVIIMVAMTAILSCSVTVNAATDEPHIWSEWVTDVEPTCTSDGHMYRVCTYDPKFVHTEEKVIPALGHNYSVVDTAPTCTERGVKTYTCSRCGNTYSKEYGEALGHDYSSKVTKKATCKEEGVRTYTCSRCHKSYTKAIPKLKHDYSIKKVITKPNCKHVGKRKVTCSICGESYTEEYGKLTEHQFKRVTTEENGYKIVKDVCSVCGETRLVDKELIPVAPAVTKTVKPEKKTDYVKVANVAVSSATAASLLVFGLLLYPDFLVLAWYKKRRKAVIESHRWNGGV